MKKKINIEDLSEEEIVARLGQFLMGLPPGGLGDLSDIEKMYEEECAEAEKEKTKASRD